MKFSGLFMLCASVNIISGTFVNTKDLPSIIPAERICKSGPASKNIPGKLNCLIIGDSISIGYTPRVAERLGNSYQVHHAPWDDFDGGALDSRFGLRCLQLFLLSNQLEPANYDVIIFNFGLHDLNFNGKLPEEYNTPTEYQSNLRGIKSLLLSTGAKVGYVLTTPVVFNNTLSDGIKLYNNIANQVMKEHPAVATADLYQWVIEGCHKNCVTVDRALGPHFTEKGYRYISEKVKDLILSLTRDSFNTLQSVPLRKRQSLRIQGKPNVPCRDLFGEVLQVCPYNSTCCELPSSLTGQGCCLWPQAVPCGDGSHCCPAGYKCDPSCSSGKKCSCQKMSNLISPHAR